MRRRSAARILAPPHCRLLTIYTSPTSNGNVLKSASSRARRLPGAPAVLRPASGTPQPRKAAVVPPRAVGADHPITLLKAHSLTGLVQREIERMILAGDLAAGAQLRETEVAAMLGVSRGPVREAFRALEESGLVRLEKNRGAFVRQIDVDEADDIFEVRAVLDEFAGRRAAQSASPGEAAQLRDLVLRMEKAAGRGDVDAYHDANLAFHDRIVELAGNPKLTTLYRRLVNELHLHRRTALGQAGILPLSMREHRAIVEHRPDLENVVGLVDVDLAHEHAAILLEADEPGFLERAKRLAHRAARHAEHRGDLRLAQLRPCREIAGEDHALDLALREPGQRMRLEQRDRMVGGEGARLRNGGLAG